MPAQRSGATPAGSSLVGIAALGEVAVFVLLPVGEGDATFAVLFFSGPATGAGAVGVNDDADANEVAHFELRDGGANGFDGADDLMTRHHWVDRVAPLIADGVDVGVADAAPLDSDVDIVVVELAAGEFE